jgi:hypothetical protein
MGGKRLFSIMFVPLIGYLKKSKLIISMCSYLQPFRWAFLLILGISGFTITGCGSSSDEEENRRAEGIIQEAVKKHGGASYQEAAVNFQFRDRQYRTVIDEGRYRYMRQYEDSSGAQIMEVLTNDSVYRKVNGKRVKLDDETRQGIKGSLNAINYFFLLPYHLTDQQVAPTYIDSVQVEGEPYHKIRVTFDQAEQSNAHEDIYLYWFHTDHYTMDYLAYQFFVNGGGMRFRVANNVREKGGIRFQDYLNLAPKFDGADFRKIDSLYEEGDLKKVSEINKDSIQVKGL